MIKCKATATARARAREHFSCSAVAGVLRDLILGEGDVSHIFRSIQIFLQPGMNEDSLKAAFSQEFRSFGEIATRTKIGGKLVVAAETGRGIATTRETGVEWQIGMQRRLEQR